MREVVHYQFGAAFVRPTEAELHKVLPRWVKALTRLHPELLGLLGENPEDPENRAAILDRLIPQPEIVEQQIASSIATFAGITIDNDSTTSLKVLGMVLNSAAELPAFLFETGKIPKAILEVRNTGAAMVYSWLIELNEIIPQIRWSELVTAASRELIMGSSSGGQIELSLGEQEQEVVRRSLLVEIQGKNIPVELQGKLGELTLLQLMATKEALTQDPRSWYYSTAVDDVRAMCRFGDVMLNRLHLPRKLLPETILGIALLVANAAAAADKSIELPVMDGLTLITDLAHEAGNLRQNDAGLYLELYPLLLIVTAGWAFQALTALTKNYYSRSGMASDLIHELTHALQFLPKGDQRTFGMLDIEGIEATGSYDVSE